MENLKSKIISKFYDEYCFDIDAFADEAILPERKKIFSYKTIKKYENLKPFKEAKKEILNLSSIDFLESLIEYLNTVLEAKEKELDKYNYKFKIREVDWYNEETIAPTLKYMEALQMDIQCTQNKIDFILDIIDFKESELN